MSYNFDTIATNYDRMNRIMTMGLDRRWRKRAVKGLQGNVLDVACGTGDMVLELCKRGCTVTGVDLSEEMLKIARQKTASANSKFSIFNFQLCNAEALPFADGEFDAVTCAFGIRNFEHLEIGLKEMARVMKVDGKMIIAELSTPDSILIRPFYNLYSHHIIPLLGSCIAGNRDAYSYLPSSIEQFPKGAKMLKILESCGLHAKQRKLFFGVCRIYNCTKL